MSRTCQLLVRPAANLVTQRYQTASESFKRVMAEPEKQEHAGEPRPEAGQVADVIRLYPAREVPEVDEGRLALLVACGATIEQIAHLAGRSLEHVYRDLVALRLKLVAESEDFGAFDYDDLEGPADAI